MPTPTEQADDLILWVGNNQLSTDQPTRASLYFLGAWVGTSLFDRNPHAGIVWLFEHLRDERGLLKTDPGQAGVTPLQLTRNALRTLLSPGTLRDGSLTRASERHEFSAGRHFVTHFVTRSVFRGRTVSSQRGAWSASGFLVLHISAPRLIRRPTPALAMPPGGPALQSQGAPPDAL